MDSLHCWACMTDEQFLLQLRQALYASIINWKWNQIPLHCLPKCWNRLLLFYIFIAVHHNVRACAFNAWQSFCYDIVITVNKVWAFLPIFIICLFVIHIPIKVGDTQLSFAEGVSYRFRIHWNSVLCYKLNNSLWNIQHWFFFPPCSDNLCITAFLLLTSVQFMMLNSADWRILLQLKWEDTALIFLKNSTQAFCKIMLLERVQ